MGDSRGLPYYSKQISNPERNFLFAACTLPQRCIALNGTTSASSGQKLLITASRWLINHSQKQDFVGL